MTHSLQRWASTKILDLTAALFNFYKYYRRAKQNTWVKLHLKKIHWYMDLILQKKRSVTKKTQCSFICCPKRPLKYKFSCVFFSAAILFLVQLRLIITTPYRTRQGSITTSSSVFVMVSTWEMLGPSDLQRRAAIAVFASRNEIAQQQEFCWLRNAPVWYLHFIVGAWDATDGRTRGQGRFPY